MTTRRLVLSGLALIVTVMVLAACGNGEWTENAHKGDRSTGPADIINFPDGFRNVAHKCDGPNMVYVASRGDDDAPLPSDLAVVTNDPRCSGSR